MALYHNLFRERLHRFLLNYCPLSSLKGSSLQQQAIISSLILFLVFEASLKRLGFVRSICLAEGTSLVLVVNFMNFV